MYTVKDVPANEFIKAYAEHLKKNDKIKIPGWSDWVTTATGKDLAPLDDDWFYIRAAALARKVYVRGNTGVGVLRHFYGFNKKIGNRRSHHS